MTATDSREIGKRVLIACPNEGAIHPKVTMMMLRYMAEPKGCVLSYNMNMAKPSDTNRNTIIKQFLEGEGEYLFFVDSDNPPFVDVHPLELVAGDFDVIGLPTPLWDARKQIELGQYPLIWNAFDWREESQGYIEHGVKAGIQEVDAVGSGAMIIARRVLEKVKPAFERIYDEHGIQQTGRDLNFCKRAKEAVYKIHVSFEHPCSHYKIRDQAEIIRALGSRDMTHLNEADVNSPEYWDDQWRVLPERVPSFYKAIVEELNGGRVLDFGCGRGDLLSMLGPNAEGMDFSPKAVEICKARGLKAKVGTEPVEKYDCIVATEVLPNLEDPEAMLKKFFEHTDKVVYVVPNNCMPPGIVETNRRLFTPDYVSKITPGVKSLRAFDPFMLIVAEKEPENAIQ